LEETNRKIVELQDELVEKDRKRDEQIEELQNALLEKDRKRDEQIEEIRQESKRQFDLLMSRVLGKMVVWHICFVMI
jgi:16S rRNA G527 N7-methylase RsmG